MKKIKCLLILLSLVSWLSVKAQGFAQMPTASFRSTSTMMSTGSSLPVSARSGVTVTGGVVGTYADASCTARVNRMRRGVGDDEGTENEEEYKKIGDLGVPVGDAVLPLMLLLGAYAGVVALRRRKASAES